MTIDARQLLEHRDFLRRLARSLVDDPASEDAVQSAYLRARQRPPCDVGALRTWLARVTVNFALQGRRSHDRRKVRERAAARGERLPSTDEIVARGELMRRVVDAVFALDEPYRTTIVLRFYEGLSASEIASRSEVPVETVRTRLKRALARLRRQLDEEHHGGRSAIPFIGMATMGTRTHLSLAGSLLFLTLLGGSSCSEAQSPVSSSRTYAAFRHEMHHMREIPDAEWFVQKFPVLSTINVRSALEEQLTPYRGTLAELRREKLNLLSETARAKYLRGDFRIDLPHEVRLLLAEVPPSERSAVERRWRIDHNRQRLPLSKIPHLLFRRTMVHDGDQVVVEVYHDELPEFERLQEVEQAILTDAFQVALTFLDQR